MKFLANEELFGLDLVDLERSDDEDRTEECLDSLVDFIGFIKRVSSDEEGENPRRYKVQRIINWNNN